jgi:hypothetical protein
MTAKLIALAVLVALAAIPILEVRVVHSPHAYSSAEIAAVLPRQIGDYRIVQEWNTQPPSGWLWLTNLYDDERGAVYSRGGSYPEVRVDLLLGTLADHNPLGCRLARGATTEWSRLQSVATAHANATVEISLAREASHTELIASSECYASGCTEIALPSSGFILPRPGQLRRLFDPAPSAVVPVAIVVAADQCDRRDCGAILQTELSNFLAAFDLDRIRAFAAKAR